MASSGTIIGSKSGTRPFLELDWSIDRQEIANNRSRVRLRLYLRVTSSSIGYSARYTGRLQGASFTSSSGYISTSGRYLLTERYIWVNHNSNGTKTETFTADYNLNMTWSGTYYGNITLRGTGALDPIPRASSLSAFSFRYTLQVSTSNEISYTVDRKSGSFRHQIQLRDGSHVIETWDNVSSNGASTLTLTDSKVNEMIKRMSNSESKSFTLRVATRSGVGGSWIGSAVTRNATATINSNVKPTANGVSTSISGNGRDSAINKYVQGVTRVYASFSGVAGYGATASSYRIQIRRVSGGANSQLINASSGTTTNPVTLSGTYEAIGTITDSRGRTDTSRREFTVEAYSPPSITSFTAVRNATSATIVNTTRAGTHTPLGGSNPLSIYIQRRQGTGAWSNLTTPTSTSSSFTGNYNSTGNNIALSYEFRLLIKDTFGNEDSEVVGVSTQRVVLDIHKNEGVGIGKIHERGVLDVNGTIYTDGEIKLQNSDFPENEVALISHTLGGGNPGIEITSNKNPHGYAYIDFNTTRDTNADGGGDSRILTSHGDPNLTYDGIMRLQSGDIRLNASRNVELAGRISLDGSVFVNGEAIVAYRSTTTGNYIKFYNGTMICWNNTTMDSGIGYNRNSKLYTSNNIRIYYPSVFIDTPAITVGGNVSGLHASFASVNNSGNSDYFFLRFLAEDYSSNTARYNYIAIGRWK